MRDPERLDGCYPIFLAYHKEFCPDWRIGQLISNFLGWHVQKYGDFYYVEDKEFTKRLGEYFNETFRG